jgi:hypothetical protein
MGRKTKMIELVSHKRVGKPPETTVRVRHCFDGADQRVAMRQMLMGVCTVAFNWSLELELDQLLEAVLKARRQKKGNREPPGPT